MSNIYIVINQLANEYNPFLLSIFPILAVISAIFVIINKNPIVSVLFLIGLFINVACTLVLLGLNFLGLSYLLVYVGAVSILFLFILMLMSIRSSDLTLNAQNSLPLGFLVASLLSTTIDQKLYSYGSKNINLIDDLYIGLDKNNTIANPIVYESDLNNVMYVSDLTWDRHLMEFSHITSIGNILYTNYSIWLILTSLILLLAMIGSIIITIKPNLKN